jgi:hypothetical protein
MDMNARSLPTVLVRAFDRGHRLHRGRKRQTFVQSSDSDIVSKVGQAAGFTVEATATSPVHDWVMQNNQTDWEFLSERAARNGFRLYVKGARKLCFEPVDKNTEEVECNYGRDLVAFRPRLSASPQSSKVTVRGWDPKTKEAIVGTATTAKARPPMDWPKPEPRPGKAAFGDADMVVVDRVVHSQAEARRSRSRSSTTSATLCRSRRAAAGQARVSARQVLEGGGRRPALERQVLALCHDPRLERRGRLHDRLRHHGQALRWNRSGRRGRSQRRGERRGADARRGQHRGRHRDPERGPRQLEPGQGQVPLARRRPRIVLGARRAADGRGGRGFQFLPEVNDEVLVAFEHGDMRRAYIVGALWNGKDAPPEKSDVAVVGGKVVHRTIKTRIGHTILLDDTDEKGEMKMASKYGHVLTLQDKDRKIEAKTKDGHVVTLDDPSKSITVKTNKGHKLFLDDTGDQIVLTDHKGVNKMTIKSGDNSIKIECLGNFTGGRQGQGAHQGAGGLGRRDAGADEDDRHGRAST